ncbi:hypothetical protein HKD37_05G014161 [Glycine soja]
MKVEEVKRKLYELWNFYAPKPKSSSSSVKPPSSSQDFGLFDDLIEYKEQVASDSGKSQLDTYLEEAALNMHFTAHMDVLDWWETNSPRFPHLSIKAYDDDLFDEDSIVKTTSSEGASNVVDVD